MASQMVDARVLRTTIEIAAAADGGETGRVHGIGQGDRVRRLPPRVRRGQRRSCRRSSRSRKRCSRRSRSASASTTSRRAFASPALEPKHHETSPPARYTEASLIKELERIGIGRPSTYAATIGTIERRGYVFRQGKALVPSFTAFAVTRLLREHFGDLDRRRVHRGNGGRPRPDLARRTRMARFHPAVLSRRRASSRARGSGEAGGRARRLSAHRRRRRSRVGRADPRAHRTLRSVPAAGRRRTRQDGEPAADAGARRPDRREGDGARARQGRGAAAARRRSQDRHERVRHQRPVRRLRPAGRDAREGREGEAEAVVAHRRSHRIDGHARRRR